MKNKSGITLIALIITIIVMLILVAVTITMAVNGGLFGYAGNATKDTELEKNKELEIANLRSGMSADDLIDNFSSGSDLNKLRKYFVGKSGEDVMEVDENSVFGFHFKDVDPISDASISISVVGGDEVLVVEYNDHFYFISYDDVKFTDVSKVR